VQTSFKSEPGAGGCLASRGCCINHERAGSGAGGKSNAKRGQDPLGKITRYEPTEHWYRLPREAVESPSLEIFKTHLYKVLCSLL